MNSMYEDVCRFSEQILRQEFPESPTMISKEFVMERFKFIQEEQDEFLKAALAGDIVGAVDGLLDTVYVALGTLFFMGIPADQCWDEVQKANMKKLPGVTSRGNKIDAIKPDGWIGPEAGIARIIEKAIDR